MVYSLAKDMEKNDKPKPQLEMIQWLDHCSFHISQWRPYWEIEEMDLQTCNSVGWVIYEDKYRVNMVSTVHKAAGAALGDIIIVKSAIVKRWKLKDHTTP